jgi:hypothetical protein
MLADSITKLESAVDFIEHETETLNWLMNAIPFDDPDLHELAIRQLKFQFGKEVFEYESHANELEDNLEKLKDEIQLVPTLNRGLKSENESLKTKIVKGREFEQELVEGFQKITERNESNGGGISNIELGALIRENEQRTKRDLAQLKSEFEIQFRAIEPSPEYLNDEIETKEQVTELLNAKICELHSELDKIAANQMGFEQGLLKDRNVNQKIFK